MNALAVLHAVRRVDYLLFLLIGKRISLCFNISHHS